jgi:hypothetical protein
MLDLIIDVGKILLADFFSELPAFGLSKVILS